MEKLTLCDPDGKAVALFKTDEDMDLALNAVNLHKQLVGAVSDLLSLNPNRYYEGLDKDVYESRQIIINAARALLAEAEKEGV